jgi:hypothetical protein
MSQTKILSLTDTVTRLRTDGTGGQGCGGNKRLLAGRRTGGTDYDYASYLKPTLDWTGVGRIVSATLVVYTDDFATGLFPQPTATATPKTIIQRLTSAFTVGNNADTVFDSSDYTNPGKTTSGQKTTVMSKTANGVNRIDITDFFNLWAPKTVKQSGGSAGAAVANYGIKIAPYGTSVSYRWSGWSGNATDAIKRPTVELVYDEGVTVPDVPSSCTPVGEVTGELAFEGDFSDAKASDTLAYSEVEVYTAGKAGTAAVTDLITSTAHGLHANDIIYFPVRDVK